MLNECMLIGHLGKDPESRSTAGGKMVVNFTLATSAGKDKPADWHNIVVWEKQAETCAQYLSKGMLVCVKGRIIYRSWDDKNGQKKYITEIVANQVVFLSPKKEEQTMSFPPKLSDLPGLEDFDGQIPF